MQSQLRINYGLRALTRSTDTEDYMQLSQTTSPLPPAVPEPPRPPPPPPAPPLLVAVPPKQAPLQPPAPDTATRKQQQPLSAISIQDLNSVQVSDLFRSVCRIFVFDITSSTFRFEFVQSSICPKTKEFNYSSSTFRWNVSDKTGSKFRLNIK